MDTGSIEYIVALVTCPPDAAEQIARGVIEARVAACVNILPGVRSIYSWQGKICDDSEALLVIKTRAELFAALRAKVVELHSYEVPEVIALPLHDGHAPYLAWLRAATER